MTIYPDLTFILQLGFFVASFWALKTLFFPPILELIKRRQQMIQKANEELRERDAEGKQMQEEYARKMREARLQAQEIHNKARQESSTKEREILEKARKEASQRNYEGQVKIEEQRQKALKSFDEEAQQLTAQIVENVLGRPLSS